MKLKVIGAFVMVLGIAGRPRLINRREAPRRAEISAVGRS